MNTFADIAQYAIADTYARGTLARAATIADYEERMADIADFEAHAPAYDESHIDPEERRFISERFIFEHIS